MNYCEKYPDVIIRDGNKMYPLSWKQNDLLVPTVSTQHSPKSLNCLKEVNNDLDIEEIDLGRSSEKHAIEHFNLTSLNEHRSACLAFISAPEILSENNVGWRILVLSLLALFMDFALPALSSVPIIQLGLMTQIPDFLVTLTDIVGGPNLLKHKGSSIQRPHCIRAIVPLGATTPSLCPEDYCGGHIKTWYGKKRCWLPYTCTPVIFASNVPAVIAKCILDASPLMLPILCGNSFKTDSRLVLKMDGSAFQTVDPIRLEDLHNYTSLIYSQLQAFNCWLRSKRGRWKSCLADMEQFYPQVRSGRFQTKIITEELVLWTAALAIFKSFLYFASSVTGWLADNEAQDVLFSAWSAVLPESMPTPPRDDSSAVLWNEPQVFWTFLNTYLQENKQHIALSKSDRSRTTIALLHQLPNRIKYLIFPRASLAEAYGKYLSLHNGFLPKERRELMILHELLSWGIQVKRESGDEDITWRYTFFPKEQAPDDALKGKIPCLAIPLVQLPNSIQATLGLSDNYSDTTLPFQSS